MFLTYFKSHLYCRQADLTATNTVLPSLRLDVVTSISFIYLAFNRY